MASLWREERAAAVVPAMHEGIAHLVRYLWAEAWKAADGVHEPEREKFQRERAEHERLRAEMGQEIARLEAELSRVEAEHESARDALTKVTEELERVERAETRLEELAKGAGGRETDRKPSGEPRCEGEPFRHPAARQDHAPPCRSA